MKYKGKELKTYPEIIDFALSLKGKALLDFVKAYDRTGKYALSNVGYFAGYYDPEKMAKIHQVFNTTHPIFGRSVPK